ncbi:MAG: hydantoinase B/oxoprolinase family protein [Candidatus Heimdallarchaeota archaeon]
MQRGTGYEQVIWKGLEALTIEMSVRLRLSSFSVNIRDRADLSCAIFSEQGETIAQPAHIGQPAHLGPGFQLTAEALISSIPRWDKGDAVATNDPYLGNLHLPDISVISPVYYQDELIAFVGNRCHHSDIGGHLPGSMGSGATELYQEGFKIPPVKIRMGGEIDKGILSMIQANTRTPADRTSDLFAQIAANDTGVERLLTLISKYSLEEVMSAAQSYINYCERLMKTAIAQLPEGSYYGEDVLDDDGIRDKQLKIVATVIIHGDSLTIDYTGTDPQAEGSVNLSRSMALAGSFYAVKAVTDPVAPTNSGSWRPVELFFPPGTIVCPYFPAPVAGGNATVQRLVDTLLRAFAQVVPERIPAASTGAMTDTTLGGVKEEPSGNLTSWAFYETIAGGHGARPVKDGVDGIHTYLTNTENTPIETLERVFPFKLLAYELIGDSGGAGRFRGGMGVRRIYQMKTPVEFGISGERMKSQPWGRLGGLPGRSSRYYTIIEGKKSPVIFSKARGRLPVGGILVIETAGGGGIEDPQTRKIEACFKDWKDGRVSLKILRDIYGITLVDGQPIRGSKSDQSFPKEGK